VNSPSARRGAYDTFRPVKGAWVARLTALAAVVVFGLVAVLSPSYTGASPEMALANRFFIAFLGLVMAAGLWRYTMLRAVPTEHGLRVVNLVRTRDLEWAEIVRVGFSGGAPWAVLELTDTEEVAVMAIQRADGDLARREASRLAALVEHHQSGVSDH
jgi:hypothetical protein